MTDNDKINNLYSRIKNFELPECEDENFKQLISEVEEGLQIIQRGIIHASEAIKKVTNT